MKLEVVITKKENVNSNTCNIIIQWLKTHGLIRLFEKNLKSNIALSLRINLIIYWKSYNVIFYNFINYSNMINKLYLLWES